MRHALAVEKSISKLYIEYTRMHSTCLLLGAMRFFPWSMYTSVSTVLSTYCLLNFIDIPIEDFLISLSPQSMYVQQIILELNLQLNVNDQENKISCHEVWQKIQVLNTETLYFSTLYFRQFLYKNIFYPMKNKTFEAVVQNFEKSFRSAAEYMFFFFPK